MPPPAAPRRARTSGVWPGRRDRAVTSAPGRRARSPRRRPRSRRARSATNCVDDDRDGRTYYEDPACCTQTAAMQVRKVLIVPGPAGATKGHLSLTAILAQAGFADVDPTRDDVTAQFRNQNGEVLCATVPNQP